MREPLIEDHIDAQIFRSLVLLGWDDEEALKQALMSEVYVGCFEDVASNTCLPG